MFGDEIILIKTNASIDSKNRFCIPAKTKVEKKDKVVLYESEYFLSVYSLKEIETKLKRLNNYLDIFQKKGEFLSAEKIKQEIFYVCSCISDCLTVDMQHRIIIPKMVINKYGFEKRVFVQGEYNHINLFKDYNTFEKYKELIKGKRS